VRRSLRDGCTGRGGSDGFGPPVGRDFFFEASVVASEAVDQATVAFGRAFGWRGEVQWAEEFALFGSLAAGLFAGFSFAVESLGDGGGASLLAEGEDLDFELAALVFDMQLVADADLAGWLCWLVVRGDAAHVAGLGGLFAGLEEAGGPEPFVDAGASHAFIFVYF
jgi:hypothetical protein